MLVEVNVLDHGTKFFDFLRVNVDDKKALEMAFDQKVPFEDLGDILSGLC